MSRKIFKMLSLLLLVGVLLTACGSNTTNEPAADTGNTAGSDTTEPVVITWWHITTKDPGLSDWQKMADDYMAAHPNVVIEITVLENEALRPNSPR
jgi:raffinose/stachyose/melibiose transport system substrate-binding protein